MKLQLQKQLMIGLPSAGKTTFLAALWHVATEEDVVGALRVSHLHGDRTHLDQIRDDWLDCRPVGRTVLGGEEFVAMRLEDVRNPNVIEVVLPDLSGETFEAHWRDRQWSPEYDAIVQEAVGGILFIHPSTVAEAVSIGYAAQVMEALEPKGDAHASTNSAVAWEPSMAPTQVKLVGSLQFIAVRRPSAQPFRLAVVVSAWDLVERHADNTTPDNWLKTRLPLLDQYLTANAATFPSQVFGISAQGGDLHREADRLRRLRHASERIKVLAASAESHDITLPIRWVMS